MNLLTSASTGLEEIGREACLILIEEINDELEAQETSWHTKDKEFAAARGVAYEPIFLEKIQPSNIHHGHRPSLIEAPITEYPNLSIMAYTSDVSDDDMDQVAKHENIMFVELMCKATSQEHTDPEELLNRRVDRTADAVVAVINRNKNLNGKVDPFDDAPRVSISNIFSRSEFTGSGPTFIWQGARLDYVFNKIAYY